MPALDGATAWINSEPLTLEGLHGSAFLVQFWTYTCINWLRTLPYVRAWYEKYRDQGLVVIGVHTPEFSVEHSLDNVSQAVREMGIDYPVVVDNEYAIWNAFANQYWPAAYFVDGDRQIRFRHFGEGRYEEQERVIQGLLAEAGRSGIAEELVTVFGKGAEAPADWGSLRSGETYVGVGRSQGFASPGGFAFDVASDYSVPDGLKTDHWALQGNWTIGRDSAISNGPGGRIAYRFHARDLHLVMGAGAEESDFRVRIDGEAPGDAHGVDVDGEGKGAVSTTRLYQLVRQPGRIEDRTFEITFAEPGVEALVFTFG
jgi:thiol-disulfide isomerase/thioredoxin